MLQNAFRLGCFVLVLALVCHRQVMAQNPLSAPGTVDLAPIKDSVKKAGLLIKNGKVVECVEVVEQLTKRVLELTENAPVKELPELKKIHTELAKLHQLLTIDGAELTELPAWDDLLKAKKSPRPV